MAEQAALAERLGPIGEAALTLKTAAAARVGEIAVKRLADSVEEITNNQGDQVTRITVSDKEQGLTSAIDVVDRRRFMAGLVRGGSFDFVEGYVEANWVPVPNETSTPLETSVGGPEGPESDALVTVFRTWSAAIRGTKLPQIRDTWARIRAIGGGRDERAIRRHTSDLVGDAERVAQHYDIRNERLSEGILGDDLLLYSSGLWTPDTETLNEADRNKAERVVDLLELDDDMEVLEIGAGWGGMTETILDSNPNVRVTALVTSREQFEYLDQKFGDTYGDRLTIKLEDYREHAEATENQGRYHRVVSLEMVEHVPWEELGSQFAEGHRRMLRQDGSGKVVMQAILTPDKHYDAYKHTKPDRRDYIRREVFPAGNLHSHQSLEQAFAGVDLRVVQTHDLSESYQPHLREWRRNALSMDMPPEERRWWNAYFTLCEAGFLEGHIRDEILVIEPSRRSATSDRTLHVA